MSNRKRFICLILGPVIFALSALLLPSVFTTSGAHAVGISLWMIFWWITGPVHITITALLPAIANAFLNMVPMTDVISQYSCESIILVFGSGLITLPWALIGLDRRIALKVLSLVGPSMKSQITVWVLASTLLTTCLPNVAVCAMFTPIAVSMLHAAGYDDIRNCAPGIPILLAVGWGVSLGGTGTPLGGAMNLTAISILEEFTGQEFMYVDWISHIGPYFVIALAVFLGCMLLMPLKVKNLEGTKEYFKESYAALGPMKPVEKICGSMFLVAMLLAFTRPLYAAILPGLVPAYSFLTIGFICFFLTMKEGGPLLTWEHAQKGTLWGMMILFASGLAMGKLLNGSGASACLADLVSEMNLDGGFTTIIALVVFTRLLTEMTNGTTAAAIVCPIVFSVSSKLGINPIPYWFITTMAFNAEWLLPISVRAIPISYGLDPKKMLKRGIPVALVHMVVVILFGCAAIKLWPYFSYLPNFVS